MIYKKLALDIDLDVFCFINDIPVHIASNGGIPTEILSDAFENSMKEEVLQSIVNLNEEYRVGVNYPYLTKNILKEGEDVFTYLRTFMKMASKGFYSFDRTCFKCRESWNCHLVAWPISEEREGKSINLNFPKFRMKDFENDLRNCKSEFNLSNLNNK